MQIKSVFPYGTKSNNELNKAHVYTDDRAANDYDWTHVMKELRKNDLPGIMARKNGTV